MLQNDLQCADISVWAEVRRDGNARALPPDGSIALETKLYRMQINHNISSWLIVTQHKTG